MTTIVIDKNKNPEFRDLVADMQPGDPIKLHTTIKSDDEQTTVLTLDEAEAGDPKEADEPTDMKDEHAMDNVPEGQAPNEGGDGGRIAAQTEM